VVGHAQSTPSDRVSNEVEEQEYAKTEETDEMGGDVGRSKVGG
jgi:hypothetical protein